MKKKLMMILALGSLGLSTTAQTKLTNNPVTVINAANSVTCNAGGIITADNSFYHIYNTATYTNITDTAFFVRLLIGCELTAGGAYAVTGRVHNLVGAPVLANMSFITESTAPITPDASNYLMNIPYSAGYVLPGNSLASQLLLPATTTASFYPASNTSPETSPTYIVASGCSINDLTTVASLGFPDMRMIMHLYVNQKPTLTDFTTSVFKDQELTFSSSNFTANFNDNDNDGLNMIRLSSIPANGVLDLSGTTLAVGDTVFFSELNTLKYIPTTGYFGTDNFTYVARDSSHWSNAAAEVEITVFNWQLSTDKWIEDAISIYPNPAFAQISIQGIEGIELVRIYNAEGKEVILSNTNTANVDVSMLEKGHYFIQVTTSAKHTYISKFVKM